MTNQYDGGGGGTQPDRIDVPVYTPPLIRVPGAPLLQEGGYSEQNVSKVHQPGNLTPTSGEAGVRTEWDATSLDGAITWLETHSKYLGERVLPGMNNDILDWLNGPHADRTSFGTYPTSEELARRHQDHYRSAETSVRQIAEQLWQAAQTLRQVKKQYETAEGANEMTNANFQQAFSGQAAGSNGRYGTGSTQYNPPGGSGDGSTPQVTSARYSSGSNGEYNSGTGQYGGNSGSYETYGG